MAGFNEITLPRWQNLVRRFFGLVGPGGNVATLTPEIQPVVVIEPDTPDKRLLREERSWYDQINVSGVDVQKIKLRNPSDSNKLVIIERVRAQYTHFVENVHHGVRIGINGPAGDVDYANTGGNSIVRDLREIPLAASTLLPSWEDSPGAPVVFTVTRGFGIGQIWRDSLALEALVWNPFPVELHNVVIEPSNQLYIYGSQAGDGVLGVEIEWYERPLEASER